MKYLLFLTSFFTILPILTAQTSVKTYSSFYVHEETGDVLGWDIRITKKHDQRELSLFCGEGAPVGPVKALLVRSNREYLAYPTKTVCGSSLHFKINSKAVMIRVEGQPWERVPRHRNSMPEKDWK